MAPRAAERRERRTRGSDGAAGSRRRQASSATGAGAFGPYEIHTQSPTEVVIAIVSPLGTDNEHICNIIKDRLTHYNYDSHIINIARDLIPNIISTTIAPKTGEYEQRLAKIKAGNLIRLKSKNKAMLAIAAAARIGNLRTKLHGPKSKRTRTAYIISSLKLPEEVAELRKIYGSGFYLIAVHCDPDRRKFLLRERSAEMTAQEAELLFERDEHESDEYGQQVEKTFHLADFFVADEGKPDKLRKTIRRCLDLIFGNPLLTPTFNEFAMFMAFSSSLRSADLSRQVGAVVTRGEDIVAMGANDCPRFGGGLYWPIFRNEEVVDDPGGRDNVAGGDSNAMERAKLIDEIVSKLDGNKKRLTKLVSETGLADLTEFGRVVHAEMEALLSCGRRGVPTEGCRIFCTTFPCHNCAKHIVAAGIEEVIYVEPYPKSKALELFPNCIGKEKEPEKARTKVRFKPFVGIGPRQFFDLFSMALSAGRKIKRKDRSGNPVVWKPKGMLPRVQMLPVTHEEFEKLAAARVQDVQRHLRSKK